MKKIIDFDGYNVAEICHVYQTGDVSVKLFQIETDEEGNETIVKQDENIVFPAGYFEFTAEELEELNPTVTETISICSEHQTPDADCERCNVTIEV